MNPILKSILATIIIFFSTSFIYFIYIKLTKNNKVIEPIQSSLKFKKKKLTIFSGPMGSGTTFYISQFYNNKQTKVFPRLYRNDKLRLEELESLINYSGSKELYIIVEITFINEKVISIMKELLKNDNLYLIIDTYRPYIQQFQTITDDHIVYTVKNYILTEKYSNNKFYLKFKKNELWDKLC